MPGDDPSVELLKADLKTLRGKLATVETQQSMAPGAAGSNDGWVSRRIGAAPPEALVKLHEIATREVLSACGVPPVLFDNRPAGTAGREAWRQLLFATVAPLGRLVVAELAQKLEGDVELEWTELRASDIAGRARAFQSMVGAGMDPGPGCGLGRAHGRGIEFGRSPPFRPDRVRPGCLPSAGPHSRRGEGCQNGTPSHPGSESPGLTYVIHRL